MAEFSVTLRVSCWPAGWLEAFLYSCTAEAADQRKAFEAFVADGGDPNGIFEVEEWLRDESLREG